MFPSATSGRASLWTLAYAIKHLLHNIQIKKRNNLNRWYVQEGSEVVNNGECQRTMLFFFVPFFPWKLFCYSWKDSLLANTFFYLSYKVNFTCKKSAAHIDMIHSDRPAGWSVPCRRESSNESFYSSNSCHRGIWGTPSSKELCLAKTVPMCTGRYGAPGDCELNSSCSVTSSEVMLKIFLNWFIMSTKAVSSKSSSR